MAARTQGKYHQTDMIRTLILGATVYDGEHPLPQPVDLAIVADRVALIGSLAEREAHERIDGTGLALAPGFIDGHSHSDELWLADGRCLGKIAQGVTTEIGGNCGSSPAPLLGEAVARARELAALVGVDAGWRDLDEFYGAVERGGVALNVATLVGLGTIRRCVRCDAAGRLEPEELRRATDLVRAAIEMGALGVSSGLEYVPSKFADITELVALARASAAAGGRRYATHLRSEGDELLEAVDEALEIGRAADVAVRLSHHKAAGRKNWGKVDRSLDRIARARARGEAVDADAYPYVALQTDLETLLPADAREGDRAEILARLADPETVAALALRLKLDRTDLEWSQIVIASVGSERNAELAGLRLDAIAERWRVSPPRAALRLLLEERLVVEALVFAMAENDVATVLSADFVSVASDAAARAIDGPTARGVPHPRTFGTFPRIFGRFVRGRRVLELGEAIRRMTSLPANAFGLVDRGRIAVGAYADLVLFDPATIVDTATYDRPFAYPLGIAGVWVNGTRVMRDGMATGVRPGRVLRAGRASP